MLRSDDQDRFPGCHRQTISNQGKTVKISATTMNFLLRFVSLAPTTIKYGYYLIHFHRDCEKVGIAIELCHALIVVHHEGEENVQVDV